MRDPKQVGAVRRCGARIHCWGSASSLGDDDGSGMPEHSTNDAGTGLMLRAMRQAACLHRHALGQAWHPSFYFERSPKAMAQNKIK